MSRQPSKPITELLAATGRGDDRARQELWALVYDELHRIAQQQLKYEPPGRTLQPTSLVNEVYLRLAGDDHVEWADRHHFFAIAARIMRCIRVDSARRRKRLKRGGGRQTLSLDGLPDSTPADPTVPCWPDDEPDEVLAIEEALARLERIDPRKAELVTLRFHGGLTREQIAEVLGIAPRTVDKEWYFARAWLHRELE
jgi:RNA polymerase sigma factor (TIGR02999 family)